MLSFTMSITHVLKRQAEGLPPVGCLELLIQYIRSYPTVGSTNFIQAFLNAIFVT
jgi:hypothetical protein